MNKFFIVANGQQLDTYDDINISFNYQIEDILDITKRTTNFSKTIIIPGTSFNNKFFKQIFEVNIDNITFNAKRAIPANIQVGEQDIMSGVMQLLNIQVNQKSVDYEVVIMGQLKNIIDEFGEFTLRNLDFSEFNHNRTKDVIQKSWTYDIYKNNTLINQSSPGYGYVYPYIINGQNQDILNRLYVNDLYPAIYVKTVLDKVFEYVGYTYTSNFFTGEYFNKLILPFVDDKLQMSSEEVLSRTVAVGVDGTLPETTDPVIYYPPVENYGVTGYRAISSVFQPDVPGYNNRIGSVSPTVNSTLKAMWFPFEKQTGTVGDITLQDPNNEWTYAAQTTPYTIAGSTFPFTFSRYRCTQNGYYDIDLLGYFFMKYTDVSGPNIDLNSGSIKYFIRLVKKKGTSFAPSTSAEIELAGISGEITPSQSFNYSPAYDPEPYSMNVSASNVFLEVGDQIYIKFGIGAIDTDWDGPDNQIFMQAVVLPSANNTPTVLRIRPSNNTLAGGSDEINMNQILPDIKLEDFFMSLVKMFNLVIFDDPQNPQNLIIEPRDDFYASRTRVKDWTYKLDNSQNVKITPMSELDAKTFQYTYKPDEDYYNTEYTNETKRIYGDLEVDAENDFSSVNKKLEVVFSPTPGSQYSIGDRVAPLFASWSDGLQPKKVKPRILFYGGLKNTNYPLLFKDTKDSATGVTITQYPYCGMWDDPYSPTNDLSFGTTSKIYYNGPTSFPVNTLVEKFHKNTLIDILDINSKLLEASFHLTPADIADLDFRDIILIDNAYWRLNNIKDYNPIGSDKTTNVILYKINNINIFAPDRVELSLSNKSCPSDVVKQFTKKGSIYTSASGQILDANCCSSLNGDFINGVCYVRTRLEDIKGVKEGFLKSSNFIIQGGTNMTPNSQDRPEALMVGNNTNNSPGVLVRGTSNYIDYGANQSIVIGDGNGLLGGTKNVQILGDGNSVSNNIENAFVFGKNNIIEVDTVNNTGQTATTLANIFVLGDNQFITSGNTLYVENIQIQSGGTINGQPSTAVTNPSLNVVLTNGNETGGKDIIMSQDDKIRSFTGDSYIEFNKVSNPLIKLYSSNLVDGTSDVGVSPLDLLISHSDTGTTVGSILIDNNSLDITYTNGVDKDTEIKLDKEFIELTSLNTDDGYLLKLEIDGQNNELVETVGDSSWNNFSRTTRQTASITDYCGNAATTDYSTIYQSDVMIDNLFVSGSTEMVRLQLTPTNISGYTSDGGGIYTSVNYTPGAFDFVSTDITNTVSINTSSVGAASIDMLSTNGTINSSAAIYDSSIQLNIGDGNTFNNNISLNSSISSPYGMTITSSDPSNTDTGNVNVDATIVNINTSDGTDTSTIDIRTTDITIDTLALIIPNLPNDATGLSADQLYTQTASQLGGTGTTRVICIV